jgi:hypothetical protein
LKFISAKYVEGFDGTEVIEGLGNDGIEYFILGGAESDVPPWPEYIANGGTIAPAEEPLAPVPATISDRQFFQQLAVMGLITENEALAYVQTGTLPAAFLGFIDQLPEDQRFDAKMKLTGANSFHRNNLLVNAFATMCGMTPDQADEIWRKAASL